MKIELDMLVVSESAALKAIEQYRQKRALDFEVKGAVVIYPDGATAEQITAMIEAAKQ